MTKKVQPLHSAASWFPANNAGPAAQQVAFFVIPSGINQNMPKHSLIDTGISPLL